MSPTFFTVCRIYPIQDIKIPGMQYCDKYLHSQDVELKQLKFLPIVVTINGRVRTVFEE